MREAGLQDAFVVVELGVGELSLPGLDPGPFDAEAIAVEAEGGVQGDVFAIAVIAVAGVPGAVLEDGRFDALQQPDVGIGVVSLALVGGNRRAPQKTGRCGPAGGRRSRAERRRHHWRAQRGHHRSSRQHRRPIRSAAAIVRRKFSR